jgi:hypothetical protein
MKAFIEKVLEHSNQGSREALAKLRQFMRKNNLSYVPLGEDNSKTQVFSLYRKVGDSCPEQCSYLNKESPSKSFCYACQGKTAMISNRSSMEPEAFLRSFIICSILGIRKYKVPTRLNVSGDLALNGKADQDLIKKLQETSRIIKKTLSWRGFTGYGYTHCRDINLEECYSSGLMLRPSEQFSPGASIVWPHDNWDKLIEEHPELSFQKCKNQTQHLPCRLCKTCFSKKYKDTCIVFNPHGVCHNKFQYSKDIKNEQEEHEGKR